MQPHQQRVVVERDELSEKLTNMILSKRITEYLGNGGLFNPEAMEHDKVRQLLLDCRAVVDAVDLVRDFGPYALW